MAARAGTRQSEGPQSWKRGYADLRTHPVHDRRAGAITSANTIPDEPNLGEHSERLESRRYPPHTRACPMTSPQCRKLRLPHTICYSLTFAVGQGMAHWADHSPRRCSRAPEVI